MGEGILCNVRFDTNYNRIVYALQMLCSPYYSSDRYDETSTATYRGTGRQTETDSIKNWREMCSTAQLAGKEAEKKGGRRERERVEVSKGPGKQIEFLYDEWLRCESVTIVEKTIFLMYVFPCTSVDSDDNYSNDI